MLSFQLDKNLINKEVNGALYILLSVLSLQNQVHILHLHLNLEYPHFCWKYLVLQLKE